ncbi:MAG: hypothetical protein IJ404_06490 [Clostridia bacterium]|nr:hypothetical protein [Clostridia bacterium]
MIKKFFSVLFVSLLIILLNPTSAFALEPTSEQNENVPVVTVTTSEELVQALGSTGVKYQNGVITLNNDVVLSKSINITSGTYVIVGEGVSIKRSFDGDMFVLSGEGTSLTLGKQTTETDRIDLVFNGGNDVCEGSVFRIEQGAKLEMHNCVVIKNAKTSVSGGAVYNEGDFTMNGGVFEDCLASSSGGAIYNVGTLILASGNIEGCSANHGGAVYNEGKATFGGVVISKCNAPNGGAVFNTGELQYLSATITECTAAAKGGAIYNSGKAVITGGIIISNVSKDGEGGGIYNASELEISGSVLSTNTAKNGGNIYNCGNAVTDKGFSVTGGIASKNGGNIYNSELGIFTHSTGVVRLGEAVYGGGVYNLGTYNMGGAVYSNTAQVGEGVLNHGKLVLINQGYCEKKDDIFVVLTPENKHSIVVAENWAYGSKVYVSCGVAKDGKYEYSHSAGNKLLDIKGNVDASKSFELHLTDTKLAVSSDGTLEKIKEPVSKTLTTVICVIFAYPLVTAVIVLAVRHFDKKKLGHQTEIK